MGTTDRFLEKHADLRKRILSEAGKLVGKVDFTQLIGGRPNGIDIVKAITRSVRISSTTTP
ncbi:MAG: hypothetical protein ABW080_08130 [Candidatus Thiodiazotropha sp.]